MANYHSEKEKLMQGYVKRFFITFRILEISGFCRFIIRNGRIVARNWVSSLYNIFVVIMADIGAVTLLWTSEETLSTIEFATVFYFSIFGNLLLFHITFGDKYRGPDLIDNCIEIDLFLGANETDYLRKLTIRFFVILVCGVGITQVGVVAYMWYVFQVPIIIHLVCVFYFLWIFCAYDEFCFFVFSYWFLTTRTRYLNVALIKFTNMKMEYVPKQKLLHTIFWRDKYDDRVTFHTRAQSKDFSVAFKMLFHQLRHIERCYRFPITLGTITVMLGSFVTVQTFIMYIENSTAMARANVVTGWSITSWIYLLLVSTQNDMFCRQIELTKLICAYIQLKPSCSEEMHKLTKDVLATLEVRDPRMSLVVFFFDTGLVLKVAASTFVYITVQLQMAFPNLDGKVNNVTKPAFELTHNAIKEFLFLY